jgi:hypothetical protein
VIHEVTATFVGVPSAGVRSSRARTAGLAQTAARVAMGSTRRTWSRPSWNARCPRRLPRSRLSDATPTWRATLAEPAPPALLLATDEGHATCERIGYRSLVRFAVWSRDRPGGTSEQGDRTAAAAMSRPAMV